MATPITIEHILTNGLKVVVQEDYRAPVVVAQVWYKVGSADEPEGLTGVSHALEHMMFQGTPNLPKDGFAELVSEYGGQNNAFTTEDFTAYYEELDAAYLEVILQAEADRMTNLVLDSDAFAKELQVVIEERRLRTDDNPQSVTWERFTTVANLTGHYHHPVIGWQHDLDQLTVEDLKQWYQQWYAPNNATIIIVGAVQASEAIALVEQYFAKIPSQPLPVSKMKQNLVSLGENRLQVRIPAKLPLGLWGFNVPSLTTAPDKQEVYALLMVSALLDGGESGRFPKNLIRGNASAAALSTSYDPFKRYATQFIISGIPNDDYTMATLEVEILAQLDKLKTELVSDAELNRVKNQMLAQEVFGKDSMSEQANILGTLVSLNLPWQLASQFIDNIKHVSAQDIQLVAKKYFQFHLLTMAELIPQMITDITH